MYSPWLFPPALYRAVLPMAGPITEVPPGDEPPAHQPDPDRASARLRDFDDSGPRAVLT